MFGVHVTLLTSFVALADITRAIVPLASKRFTYPNGIPYKVDTDLGQPRGPQLGYNICNATTEGPNSLCQTALFNSLDDFCLWAPAEPGQTVGDIEGEMVAWCSRPGHGARVIPRGALTGVQFMKTPDYVQVVGFIDQTKINMIADDSGGEMDPHGADLRGNPKGGIMFSNAWGGSFMQAVEWHNFMGSNVFCLKACDPRGKNAARFCEHIYDRIGCDYNAPSNARNGVFESCNGDNQDFPGVYTENGAVKTYTQPPESQGDISSMPYVARVPASSNCKTFQSASIYNGAVIITTPSTPNSPPPTLSSSLSNSKATNPPVTVISLTGPTTLILSSVDALSGSTPNSPSSTSKGIIGPTTTGGAQALVVSMLSVLTRPLVVFLISELV